MHLRERREREGGLDVTAEVEEDREGLAQQRLRLVGAAEEERELAEGGLAACDPEDVAGRHVVLARTLGVAPRRDQLAFPLGDRGRLEQGVRDRPVVAEAFGTGEHALRAPPGCVDPCRRGTHTFMNGSGPRPRESRSESPRIPDTGDRR